MNIKYIIASAIFVAALTVTAQDKEEDRLNGGSITVVKAYDPSVSDAFKVKSVPQLNDTTRIEKKAVTYSIFSVPVASTFTPAKGKLSRLKPTKRPQYFDNYARLGLGNYGNILAEFSGNVEIDRDSDFGIYLNHNSSLGGIDEVVLDDGFLDTALDLSYGVRSRDISWSITGGARYQSANLYGVFDPFNAALAVNDPDDIDVNTNYLSYGIGGNIDFKESIFSELNLKITGLTSGQEAAEARATIGSKFTVDVQETEVDLGVELDYLTGSFDQQGLIAAQSDYAYFSTTANPRINIYDDLYKIELGAKVNYLSDIENSDGQLHIYPDINASYKLLDENVIAFAQILGGLDINSLQQFADQNVFLAPAIDIIPTDRQLDSKIGLKGRITNNLGYKIYAGYRKENDRAFYTKDIGQYVPLNAEAYEYGNVFYTQYGDLSTTLLGGSLSVDVNSQFNLTFSAQSMNYDVSNGESFENVASQLPDFTADVVGTFQVNDKLDLGTTVYFVGDREVYRFGTGVETLDSFVDLNLDANYKLNPRLSLFLRANNLTGGNYEYYLDYPVQDLQIMGGAVYKFDF
ncbi:TonB-dependent receptor [Nonlabens ponticola]|uniref:TonB-dependent receptor n=1 Tax=Nonlabens ponticola TaxID=2496866 RepID=A0A3S9MX21_9FLAO|nr:hypothetical protein [Nonlabens ponticola]AZQ43688.1 hypothetical protein EJ995_05390 [Nonlabens ponticola]